MHNEILDNIRTEVTRAAQKHAVRLVEVSIKGPATKPILELRFDSLSHPDAITFDELDAINEWVSRLMDELDPFTDSYTLEISSPGLDRLLLSESDFFRHVGEELVVKVKPTGEIGARQKYSGTLKEVTKTSINIYVDGEIHELALDKIQEARLKPSTEALFRRKDL